jgi:hypothetical protein
MARSKNKIANDLERLAPEYAGGNTEAGRQENALLREAAAALRQEPADSDAGEQKPTEIWIPASAQSKAEAVVCSQCGGVGHDGCFIPNDYMPEQEIRRLARRQRLEAESGIPSASMTARSKNEIADDLDHIQKQAARDAAFTVTQAELDADIAAAKAEYRSTKPRIQRGK